MSSNPSALPQARMPDMSALAGLLVRGETLLLAATVVFAAGMMWLAPRLPMVDLPQHAAQVALWRDLLLGQSNWTDLVRINLATPYLIGYGLMLPLSFAFSMSVATRILLTLAFLAFVWACTALRRELGGDRRLDWLFVLPFFGYCWKWGFLTFLVASPMALLFLLLALRHARAPSAGRGVVLVLAGCLLLLSHGLMFLAALFLAGLLMLEQAWQHWPRGLVARFWPYIALSCILIGFRLATQQLPGAMVNDGFDYGGLWERPLTLLVDISDSNDHGLVPLSLLTLLALFAPLLLGLRFNTRPALVLLAGLVAILLLAPSYAFQTGGLYYRFALLVPPFIGFAFRASAKPVAARSLAAMAVVIITCWSILAIQASRIAAFAQESKGFETVLAAAKPGKRAWSVSINGASAAADNTNVYWQYAAWYQADKHGFSDYNFANFPNQVIRFRPNQETVMDQHEVEMLGQYSWHENYIKQFDYIFVRGTADMVETIKKMSPCKLTTASHDGEWFLLERTGCTKVE